MRRRDVRQALALAAGLVLLVYLLPGGRSDSAITKGTLLTDGASSDAADSSATASFPPGSLGIDLDITLGDSEALATDETTMEIRISLLFLVKNERVVQF